MDKAKVWNAIAAHVTTGSLPAPKSVTVGNHTINIVVHTPGEVDIYAVELGLPSAWQVSTGMYGTVDFYQSGSGWNGASLVSVECKHRDDGKYSAKNEERANGDEFEVVADQA